MEMDMDMICLCNFLIKWSNNGCVFSCLVDVTKSKVWLLVKKSFDLDLFIEQNDHIREKKLREILSI